MTPESLPFRVSAVSPLPSVPTPQVHTYVCELVLVVSLHDGDLVAIGVGDGRPVLVVDLLRVLVRDQRRGLVNTRQKETNVEMRPENR